MAKQSIRQLQAEKIRTEMQKGRGAGIVYSHPVELEPPFEMFSHKVKAPKSGFWSLFAKDKIPAAPMAKEARPISDFGFININLPTEGKLDLPRFEKFILSLRLDCSLSFEIIGTADKISIQLVCRKNDIAMISGIFQTLFPECEAVETDDNLAPALHNQSPLLAIYHLKDSPYFPLNSTFKIDPYSVLLSNLNSITGGMAVFQIIFTSLPVKTLYEWAALRKIPSIKIGRRVLFDLNDIDTVMQKLKRPAENFLKKTRKISVEL